MKHKKRIFFGFLLLVMMLVCGCGEASRTEPEASTGEKNQKESPGVETAAPSEAPKESPLPPKEETPDDSQSAHPSASLPTEDPFEQKKESFYEQQKKAAAHFASLKKMVKKLTLTEELEEDYRYFEPIAVYYEELVTEQFQGLTEEELEDAVQGLEEWEAAMTSFEKRL